MLGRHLSQRNANPPAFVHWEGEFIMEQIYNSLGHVKTVRMKDGISTSNAFSLYLWETQFLNSLFHSTKCHSELIYVKTMHFVLCASKNSSHTGIGILPLPLTSFPTFGPFAG